MADYGLALRKGFVRLQGFVRLRGFGAGAATLLVWALSLCQANVLSAGAEDWQPYALERWVDAKVTAYCAGSCCCGAHADGRTATGRDARLPGAAVARGAIPYGSMLWIAGAGYRLADDTGGAMRQSWRRGVVHIDLRMRSHAAARQWGVRWIRVAIYRRVPRIAVAPARPAETPRPAEPAGVQASVRRPAPAARRVQVPAARTPRRENTPEQRLARR